MKYREEMENISVTLPTYIIKFHTIKNEINVSNITLIHDKNSYICQDYVKIY